MKIIKDPYDPDQGILDDRGVVFLDHVTTAIIDPLPRFQCVILELHGVLRTAAPEISDVAYALDPADCAQIAAALVKACAALDDPHARDRFEADFRALLATFRPGEGGQ